MCLYMSEMTSFKLSTLSCDSLFTKTGVIPYVVQGSITHSLHHTYYSTVIQSIYIPVSEMTSLALAISSDFLEC